MKFHIEIPRTYLQIAFVSTFALVVGGAPKIFSNGGSVERAIAAKVSIIRLIQRSCTAFNGLSPKKRMPNITNKSTEILTVIWNCKNLPTLW